MVDDVGGPGGGRFLRTLEQGGALVPLFLVRVDPDEAAEVGVTVSSTPVRANGTQRLFTSAPDQGHLQGTIVLHVV